MSRRDFQIRNTRAKQQNDGRILPDVSRLDLGRLVAVDNSLYVRGIGCVELTDLPKLLEDMLNRWDLRHKPP